MRTILVVDDEPGIRGMIALILEQRGFTVLTAEDGEQALSLWRKHGGAIDLLVSDVCMPEMDGPTLAKKLVAQNGEISALFISGSCDSQQMEHCRPFKLLSKPLCLNTFLAAVHSLTSKRAAAVC